MLLCLFTLAFTVFLLYTTVNMGAKKLLPEHWKIIWVLDSSKGNWSIICNKYQYFLQEYLFFKILFGEHLDTSHINYLILFPSSKITQQTHRDRRCSWHKIRKDRTNILHYIRSHNTHTRFALWVHKNQLSRICRCWQLSGKPANPCQYQLSSKLAPKAEAFVKTEGAEKSGNWFLARRCSTTGKDQQGLNIKVFLEGRLF